MKKHARGGSLLDRQLHNFPGVYGGPVDRSAEELDVFDDPVTLIDQKDRENLMIEVSEPHRQILANLLRRAQGRSPAHPVRERCTGCRQDLFGRGGLGGAVGAMDEEIVIRHDRSPVFSGGIARDRRGPIAAEPSQAGLEATRRVEERAKAREQRSALTGRSMGYDQKRGKPPFPLCLLLARFWAKRNRKPG